MNLIIKIFQVCDLQSKLKRTTSENTDLATSLQVYKETQDDLTGELADLKEKYREVVELLHDTRHELKQAKKRSYPGVGEHKVSEMFSETSNSSEKKAKSQGNYFMSQIDRNKKFQTYFGCVKKRYSPWGEISNMYGGIINSNWGEKEIYVGEEGGKMLQMEKFYVK